MARRKRGRKPQVIAGDPTDPVGFPVLVGRFADWMRVKNYAERTVGNRVEQMAGFTVWCTERGLRRPADVTKPILERYQRWLYHRRKDDGKPLTFRSQYTALSVVRTFFRWLVKQNFLLSNPASEIELPRLEKRLPRHVLSTSEAEAVLTTPDLSTPVGVRDRAILETFYSTGIRRMELAGLAIYDLDVERGTLMVRQGKGKKDRMIPIGSRAVAWIDKYLREVRPELVVEPDEGTIYLTVDGEAFSGHSLTALVRGYVNASGIGKTGSCHLFRHTMATLMLENGADIRFIQAMLGHVSLTTTEIYSHVAIRKLKEIHTATHPGARLQGSPATDAGPASAEDEDDATELLTSLAAEAAEEEGDGVRSEAQLARACWALCDRAGLGRMWTASGPTDEAIAIFEANGGPLSSGERVVLLSAWAFWNSADKVTLADVVYRLDDKNLRAVAMLMLALADGGHAIDEWIAAMEDAGRGGDGQVRRPSLRAGRLEGCDPDPR